MNPSRPSWLLDSQLWLESFVTINLAFLALSLGLVIRFVRTGGMEMIRMMGDPPDAGDHPDGHTHGQHHHDGHDHGHH